MARREFPKAVKVAVIRRCTGANGVIYCESCHLPAKKWQIDHIRPDGLLGEPVLSNAMLICQDCFGVKNPKDTKDIAKAKRREAKNLGIRSESKLKSRGFEKKAKQRKGPVEKLSLLPRPPLLRGE